nr:TrAP [Papaya leaf curl virus]
MRSSSPSKDHFTQVPIKVQHRTAKRRAIRRKRVDLNCGCSYYVWMFIFHSTSLSQLWIHAPGNSSLQLKQRMACLSGRFKIPCISR